MLFPPWRPFLSLLAGLISALVPELVPSGLGMSRMLCPSRWVCLFLISRSCRPICLLILRARHGPSIVLGLCVARASTGIRGRGTQAFWGWVSASVRGSSGSPRLRIEAFVDAPFCVAGMYSNSSGDACGIFVCVANNYIQHLLGICVSPAFAPGCRYSEVVILSKYLLDKIAPKFLCWKNASQIRCLLDLFCW